MIFQDKQSICTFKVLKILNSGKSKYSIMFKLSGVSHKTLQLVLRGLVLDGFVKKDDLGHKKVDYSITSKGLRFFGQLCELRAILGV